MKIFQYTYLLLSLFAVMIVFQLAKISNTSSILSSTPASEKTAISADIALPITTSGPYFSKSDNSWSLPVRVLQLEDVSIYGRPGSIARVEYVYKGERRVGWAALRIDGYSFMDGPSNIAVGEELSLQVSGDYVSAKGVDWSACPTSDKFCQYASFIEGGFPTGEDYGGLTISPSNTLIYSGSLDDDWVNGMLAWRITSED